MASAEIGVRGAYSILPSGFMENEGDQSLVDRQLRLRRIRNRLLLEVLIRSALLFVFWYCLPNSIEHELDPYEIRVGGLLILFAVIPGVIFKLWHWAEARRAVADMWAFGRFSYRDLSQMLDTRKVLQGEIRDSRLYTDVMHGQIGDSLTESEREVMQVIEQIGMLNAQAVEKRARINHSIKSGKALTESTHQRVDSNREIIAALEMQVQEQNAEMHANFERIEGLAGEVHAPDTR